MGRPTNAERFARMERERLVREALESPGQEQAEAPAVAAEITLRIVRFSDGQWALEVPGFNEGPQPRRRFLMGYLRALDRLKAFVYPDA